MGGGIGWRTGKRKSLYRARACTHRSRIRRAAAHRDYVTKFDFRTHARARVNNARVDEYGAPYYLVKTSVPPRRVRRMKREWRTRQFGFTAKQFSFEFFKVVIPFAGCRRYVSPTGRWAGRAIGGFFPGAPPLRCSRRTAADSV